MGEERECELMIIKIADIKIFYQKNRNGKLKREVII